MITQPPHQRHLPTRALRDPQAIANNTKIYFGPDIPSMFAGHSLLGVQAPGQ